MGCFGSNSDTLALVILTQLKKIADEELIDFAQIKPIQHKSNLKIYLNMNNPKIWVEEITQVF